MQRHWLRSSSSAKARQVVKSRRAGNDRPAMLLLHTEAIVARHVAAQFTKQHIFYEKGEMHA